MKCLRLIAEQESFKDVNDIILKQFKEIGNDIFISIIKRGKHSLFNFYYYKSDKNNEIYNRLKETHKNILTEVECFEKI